MGNRSLTSLFRLLAALGFVLSPVCDSACSDAPESWSVCIYVSADANYETQILGAVRRIVRQDLVVKRRVSITVLVDRAVGLVEDDTAGLELGHCEPGECAGLSIESVNKACGFKVAEELEVTSGVTRGESGEAMLLSWPCADGCWHGVSLGEARLDEGKYLACLLAVAPKADKTLLWILGHGYHVYGSPHDEARNVASLPLARGLGVSEAQCFEKGGNIGLGGALACAVVRHGPLDLVVWQSCYMGTFEIARALGTQVRALVVSEDLASTSGWDLSALLEWLDASDESYTGVALGRELLKRSGPWKDGFGHTLCVVDLEQLLGLGIGQPISLARAWDEFAVAAKAKASLRELWAVRNGGRNGGKAGTYVTQVYGDPAGVNAGCSHCSSIDMLEFAARLAALQPSLVAEYEALREAFGRTVLDHTADSALHAESRGLALLFPSSTPPDDLFEKYGSIVALNDPWLALLQATLDPPEGFRHPALGVPELARAAVEGARRPQYKVTVPIQGTLDPWHVCTMVVTDEGVDLGVATHLGDAGGARSSSIQGTWDGLWPHVPFGRTWVPIPSWGLRLRGVDGWRVLTCLGAREDHGMLRWLSLEYLLPPTGEVAEPRFLGAVELGAHYAAPVPLSSLDSVTLRYPGNVMPRVGDRAGLQRWRGYTVAAEALERVSMRQLAVGTHRIRLEVATPDGRVSRGDSTALPP